MKWNVELINAKHRMETGCSLNQLAYYDTMSDCLVPMIDEHLCPKLILQMEEFSQSDEGVIFMDYKTHKIGLIIRN